MTFAEWLVKLSVPFPTIHAGNCRLTSPVDGTYNCIAWAADDPGRWWWPDRMMQTYWPPTAPREETLAAFEIAFGLLGYSARTDDSVKQGTQKVAIFINNQGTPTHAARQLADGWWTSKLGPQIDIEHELSAIQGPIYGSVGVLLGRNTIV
jgi:hypothetical protein